VQVRPLRNVLAVRATIACGALENRRWGNHTHSNDNKDPPNHARVPYNLRLRKMAAEKQNLQDAFLNNVRKSKVPVTIFLMNGVKLQGVITWFDNFCVLLRRDGQSQLVYKHAISTVMPSQPITLYEAEDH